MNHVAYQPAGSAETRLEADYVVVGSGAGGASAAVSFARGGASVVLVEAGPWRAPGDYPSSMVGSMRDLMDDWNINVARGKAFWPVVQASVVGGTTVVNSAITVNTPGDIFDHWREAHGIFNGGEDEKLWAYQEQMDAELSVSTTPKETGGHSNRLAELGARKLGYHDHDMHRYVKDCLGTGQCLQGCKAERKQSLNITYVPEMLGLGGHLLSCAPVRRVLTSAPAGHVPTGNTTLKEKGFTKLVKRDEGVYENVTATDDEARYMKAGDPSTRPHIHKKVGD